ncbi:hypothetical protein Bca4012_081659 [Brassica carinata]
MHLSTGGGSTVIKRLAGPVYFNRRAVTSQDDQGTANLIRANGGDAKIRKTGEGGAGGNTNVSWLFRTDCWFSSSLLQDWFSPPHNLSPIKSYRFRIEAGMLTHMILLDDKRVASSSSGKRVLRRSLSNFHHR